MFMVSPVTARKWAARFRAEGAGGMTDRSSRPRSMSTKTPPAVVKRIVKARWRRRLGPMQIAGELVLPASTVHAVLVRCRINKLSRIDRVTGEPIRCYEHDHPDSLIHVDVTKFGNIPDGGWRFVGRAQSERNREATATRTQSRNHRYAPRLGTAFVHTVIDDHSRVAYVEIALTRKLKRRSVSSSALSPGSLTGVSPLSSAFSWITARPTSRMPGVMPALSSGLQRRRPAPTTRRPTGRSNASTAPPPRAGPMLGSTDPKPSAAPHYRAGCTSTITPGTTLQSEPHPSTGSKTTCLNTTS